MAGLAASRVLILSILICASNCFPTKKALDAHKGYNSNPSSGSNWEVPARGFVLAKSGSSAALNPAHQSAPHEQRRYIPPSAQIGPVPALYTADAPYHPRYDGSPPAGSSFQMPPNQDNWAVQPPGLYPGRTSSSSTQRTPLEIKALSPSYASPSVHSHATFQPGDVSYVEKRYDHGNYDSETEEQSFPKYPVLAVNRFPVSSLLPLGPFIESLWFQYPNINYLMSRWYPPGTYTLSSSSLDHGKNQWHDTHYPASSITQHSQTFADPGSMKQPRQSVQSGNAGVWSQ